MRHLDIIEKNEICRLNRLFLLTAFFLLAACSTSMPYGGDEINGSGEEDSDSSTATVTDSESDTTSDSQWLTCQSDNPCTSNGNCISTDGRLVCECNTGWTGETCDECAPGWHLDGDVCILDEKCLSTSCAFHEIEGGCEVQNGEVVCDCEGHWDADAHCAQCLDGYHVQSDDCVPNVFCVGQAPCENGGTCGDDGGMISCDCATAGMIGFSGNNWDGEYCEVCPSGYYADGENCMPNQECALDSCGDHGICVVEITGTIECVCDDGWTEGDLGQGACGICEGGYHHPVGDSDSCVLDDECLLTTCGDGSCEVIDGVVQCVCPQDSFLNSDAYCSECILGYHFDGAVCVLDDSPCSVQNPCGSNGTCLVEDGVKHCDCAPLYAGLSCQDCINGYQDGNGDGNCLPSCETAMNNGLDCGESASCAINVATGIAVCDCLEFWTGTSCGVCPTGYHVNGADCIANDVCQPDTCNGHGDCIVSAETGIADCYCDTGWVDDFFGTMCSVCATGYQNTYSPDVCQPTCPTAQAAGLDCGSNGSCALNIITGSAYCSCNPGYAGSACLDCDSGYHADGATCVEDDVPCALDDPCIHGTCVYSSGVKSCTCDDLFVGAICDACISGYQDDNDDNVCAPTCVTAVANGLNCGTNGTCIIDGTSGLAVCDCVDFWTGTSCDVCPTGYHVDAGNCVANETCLADTCNSHGTCYISSDTGLADCSCDTGWEDDISLGNCAVCATGYHFEAGSCVVDEQCQLSSCNGNGTCSLVSGVVTCTCNPGFTSLSYCADCAIGFHESAGACVPNVVCATNSCNEHGTCDDSSSEIVCTCEEGWADDETLGLCSVCDENYHEISGTCVLNESCIDSSCSYHGICDDTSGVVTCGCSTGYTGDYCENCDTGYHIDYTTGDCIENETCVQLGPGSSDCNGNGSCVDSTGIVICTCEPGWDGDTCAVCAIGYHMEVTGCEADEVCSDSSCANGGECFDDVNPIRCECINNWAVATNCTTCDVGFHIDSGVCVADEVCDVDSCNGNGNCSIVGGLIDCDCDTGYLGQYCDSCDTGAEYSACGSVCCDSGTVCDSGACCTPLACDDLTDDNFTECGSTTFSDMCGGTIDCGDCGANGSCFGETCTCDPNYGVLTSEHECTYACEGYLSDKNCCANSNWLVYCDGSVLKTAYCAFNEAPQDVCGWNASIDPNRLDCYDAPIPQDQIDDGVTDVCPSNISVDTTPPTCADDSFEPNNVDDLTAPQLVHGEIVWGTKCPRDEDFYRVYLEAGQTVTATLTFSHATADLDLLLGYEWVDENTFTQLVLWSSTGADVESVSFRVGDEYPYYGFFGAGVYPEQYTAPGDYYFKIWASSAAYAGYQLEISITGP